MRIQQHWICNTFKSDLCICEGNKIQVLSGTLGRGVVENMHNSRGGEKKLSCRLTSPKNPVGYLGVVMAMVVAGRYRVIEHRAEP